MKKISIFSTCVDEENFVKIHNAAIQKYEITRNYNEADFIIYPVCTSCDTTIDSHKNELDSILSTKKDDAKVIVCGCINYVIDDRKKFLNDPRIDYIVRKENEVEDICKILNVKNIEDANNYTDGVTKINISSGCLNHCSFCRVHYAPRPLKSLPIEKIIEKAKNSVSKDSKVICLTGLNTAQYGLDLYNKQSLDKLLQELSKIEGLDGIIISCASLSDLNDDLLYEFKTNEKVKEVVIDIQSGSDRLLKLMNVGHTASDIRRVINYLGDKVKSTRIISGFPTENESDIKDTINIINELCINNVAISDYVNSSNTPSSKLPQLKDEDKKKHYDLYSYYLKNKNVESFEDIGIVVNISSFFIDLYLYSIGRIKLPMREEYYDLNLKDVVKIKKKNKKVDIQVLERCKIETQAMPTSSDESKDYLMDMSSLTSFFAQGEHILNHNLNILSDSLYALSNSEEEYKEKISGLPKKLQLKLMISYYRYNK